MPARRLVATVAVISAGIGAFAFADRRVVSHAINPNCALQTFGSGTPGSGCNIDIVEDSLTLAPPMAAATAHVQQAGTMTTMLKTATITGANPTAFAFATAGCTANNCDFSAAPHGLPTTLDITCTPTSTMQFAQLDVLGTIDANDTDSAQLMCAANTSTGPVLALSTHAITAPDTPVGMTSDGQPALVIANAGSGVLHVGLAPTGDWSIQNGTCVGTQCAITGGNPVTVTAQFHPAAHGQQSSLMAVTSDDPMHMTDTITLSGNGTGSILDASPTDVDFGSIPKNQTVSRTVTISDGGNVDLPVALGTPAAPFGVSAPTVTATPATPATFEVTCASATPVATTTGSVSLTSTAYQANTSAIALHCQVVDTEVQVTPTSFDFGEVRVHSATQTMTVAVTNAGSSPASLTALHLSDGRPGLSLSPNDTSTSLAAGASITATLELVPDTEVVLDGTDLVVDVDGNHLRFPVTGKVVRAASHVTPSKLDLGTVCVGSSIDATENLVNDGTATLIVQQPTMDQTALVPLFQEPTMYPAMLPAGQTATISVAGSTAMAAALHGVLTWDDDVASHYVIPVDVEYISTGTAISPASIDFGQIEVNFSSGTQRIVLENCDDSPVMLDKVVVTEGELSAWDVEPAITSQVVPPHATVTLSVVFTPHHYGHFAAHVDIDVGGGTRHVFLNGDAIGGLDATDFYACSCSGPGAPSRGWPVLAALVFVIVRRGPGRRRRRRGTTTASTAMTTAIVPDGSVDRQPHA